MDMAWLRRCMERKPIGGEDDAGLRRSLGPGQLVGLGVGAVVGAGLFSLTGIAAADYAGPAVVLSFVIAALGCAFTGLCCSLPHWTGAASASGGVANLPAMAVVAILSLVLIGGSARPPGSTRWSPH